MKRLLVCLALSSASAIAVSNGAATTRAAAPDTTRTLYFSAVDAKGAPVTDLKTEEMSVKDGGKDRQITSVAPATTPMHIWIIVDDGGSGGFQSMVGQFLQALLKRAQFAITSLNPGPVLLTDFTADAAVLNPALAQLAGRGKVRPDGDQLVDVIGESAASMQQRNLERPVIVALSVNGEDTSADVSDRVVKRLQASGVMLNAVFLTSVTTGQVLNDGPKQSGGVSEGIAGSANLGAAMQRVYTHLANLYAITYTLPEGTKPADRVSITTKRKDVKLVAPTHVPDR